MGRKFDAKLGAVGLAVVVSIAFLAVLVASDKNVIWDPPKVIFGGLVHGAPWCTMHFGARCRLVHVHARAPRII